MVSEQSEMIQRIDANTYVLPAPFRGVKTGRRLTNSARHREDVVDNVEGAQKELLRYWSRVSGNRWLIAKMFGVLVRCAPSYLPSSLPPSHRIPTPYPARIRC